jgi:hypothetical protein
VAYRKQRVDGGRTSDVIVLHRIEQGAPIAATVPTTVPTTVPPPVTAPIAPTTTAGG